MAPDGKGVAMVSIPLDLEALLAEASYGEGLRGRAGGRRGRAQA